MPLANWAGNHVYRAARAAPAGDARRAARDRRARAARARARLAALVQRHRRRGRAGRARRPAGRRRRRPGGRTVSCGAGLTYGELADALARAGPGAAQPRLAAAHLGRRRDRDRHARLGRRQRQPRHGGRARSSSSPPTASSSPSRAATPDFDGVVVGLGALGVVTRVTLDVEPAYEVRQRVFEGLGWDALHEHFDEITAGGYSVSVFTRWGETVDQVWVKSRVDRRARAAARGALRRASPRRSTATRSSASTRQLHAAARRPGPVVGPPAALPHGLHARATARRSSPSTSCRAATPWRRSAPCARWPTTLRPVLQVTEIRTIAADELWMSPQYGRDTVALHFTWKREPEAVARVLVDIEAALAPFGARPHWGKVFARRPPTIAPLYERLPDFARLAQRLDPRGAFRNELARAPRPRGARGRPTESQAARRLRGAKPCRAAPAARRPRAPRPPRPAGPRGAGPRRRR